jgi:pimeloyl-ACP methyl ester carboxylesterase
VLYGDHYWMRPNEPSARATMKNLKDAAGTNTSVEILPNAGHHLYLENPRDFAKHVVN